MSIVKIGAHEYRIDKINAIEQFHIVRRLGPALAVTARDDGGIEKLLPLIAESVAKMSNDDANYVLFGLLGAAHRKMQQGLGFAPVSRANVLMFDDMNMVDMLKIASEVFKENMQGFLSAARSLSSDAGQNQSELSNG